MQGTTKIYWYISVMMRRKKYQVWILPWGRVIREYNRMWLLAEPTSDLALQGTRIWAEWMVQAYGKRCERESRMGMMAIGEEMCTVQRTSTTNTTKLDKQLESQDLGIGNKSNVLMHGYKSWRKLLAKQNQQVQKGTDSCGKTSFPQISSDSSRAGFHWDLMSANLLSNQPNLQCLAARSVIDTWTVTSGNFHQHLTALAQPKWPCGSVLSVSLAV